VTDHSPQTFGSLRQAKHYSFISPLVRYWIPRTPQGAQFDVCTCKIDPRKELDTTPNPSTHTPERDGRRRFLTDVLIP
ncbi:MAG: hypothetical protein AAFY04_04230, partial [Pseudomonadota bacterium]